MLLRILDPLNIRSLLLRSQLGELDCCFARLEPSVIVDFGRRLDRRDSVDFGSRLAVDCSRRNIHVFCRRCFDGATAR